MQGSWIAPTMAGSCFLTMRCMSTSRCTRRRKAGLTQEARPDLVLPRSAKIPINVEVALSRYDFKRLSWIDFQELARDLLQKELGLRLESFGEGRDLGIDLQCRCQNEFLVVQVKHFENSGFHRLLNQIKKEVGKIVQHNITRYVLVTSVSLTPERKLKLLAAMSAIPVVAGDIFGKEDLHNLLQRYPDVEKSHFKLWLDSVTILDRVLHSALYNRTEAEMADIKRFMTKFVYNSSLPKALTILQETGALIIAGPPGIGKSTLARSLLWIMMQEGWKLSVVDSIEDIFTSAYDNVPHVIFFDDFLGQVRLTHDILRAVDQRFPSFLRHVSGRKDSLRVIVTTRDYLLKQAQEQSGRLDDHSVSVSHMVLDVSAYTKSIKAKILYNHIYFSDLDENDKADLLSGEFYLEIINHPNFNPRIIEQITSKSFISMNALPIQDLIRSVLRRPDVLWKTVYRSHLNEYGRILLLALLFSGDRVHVNILYKAFERLSVAMGRPVVPSEALYLFKSTLKEMEGSIIAIEGGSVRLSNPGVQDFLESIVREDNLIPFALQAATHLREFNRVLAIYKTLSPYDKMQSRVPWAEAVSRFLLSGNVTAIQGLDFAVKTYKEVRTEKLEMVVDEAIVMVASTSIENHDARRAASLLDSLSCLDRESQAEQAVNIVCAKLVAMLEEDGFALEIDDIDYVVASLESFFVDPEALKDALAYAMDGYVQNLSQTLGHCSSSAEVGDLKDYLVPLLEKAGMNARSAIASVDDRFNELLEQEEERHVPNPTNIRLGAVRDVEELSDDDIKSMFKTLCER